MLGYLPREDDRRPVEGDDVERAANGLHERSPQIEQLPRAEGRLGPDRQVDVSDLRDVRIGGRAEEEDQAHPRVGGQSASCPLGEIAGCLNRRQGHGANLPL